MPSTITSTFEITGWDETVYDEPAEGAKLSQITVTKRFTGPLEATSTAQLLTAISPALDGRTGTFVIQHGAIFTMEYDLG